jgi:hypothetical protein
MKEIETLRLHDSFSNEECWVMIRACREAVAFCLSLPSDGDLEVSLSKEDCRKLIAALTKALVFPAG